MTYLTTTVQFYYLYNRESVASYNGGNTKVEYDSYSMVPW